jgi:hypothetical protein
MRYRRTAAVAMIATALVATAAIADDQLEPVGLYPPQYFAEHQEIDKVGDYLYIFGVGGLDIVDFGNPAAPVSLGRYEPPGHPFERYYRGSVGPSHAYCGAREDRLHIIDITNPGAPIRVGTYGAAGETYEGSVLYEGFLYAARHDDGIVVLDLGDPAVPVLVDAVASFQNAWDAAALGTHVYVADGAGGLGVLDAVNAAAPVHVISLPTSGNALDVATAPGLVAVACGSAGVDIFDATTPGSPALLSTYDSAGLAISIELHGDRLYLADWDGVDVVDLINPAAPVVIGHEDTPVRAMGLAGDGDRVYVADWSKVRAYDLGPTATGDIDLSVDGFTFGSVPVGSSVDTVFTITNTGGGVLDVTSLESFNMNFIVSHTSGFTLAPGASQDVTVTFNHVFAGYDGTFLSIDSDDADEDHLTMPLTADDNPNRLDIGEYAPDFSLVDMDGVVHSLSQYRGEVVLVAFSANW